jgi:hypothetical protein
MSTDQFVRERLAAGAAAAVCRAVDDLDGLLRMFERDELELAITMLASALLRIVNHRLEFEGTDELFNWFHSIVESRGGDCR